jgi:putative phosphoesterase
VADTHVGEDLVELPEAVLERLAGVDLVLHLGDVSHPRALADLARIAPVVAVQGDHDRRRGFDLPRRRVVRVGGRRIGMTHGRRPRGVEVVMVLLTLVTRRLVLVGLHRTLRRRFGDVDLVLHGHLHLAARRDVGGVPVVSPGGVYAAEDDPAQAGGSWRRRLYIAFRRSLDREARAPSVATITIGPDGVEMWILPLNGGQARRILP